MRRTKIALMHNNPASVGQTFWESSRDVLSQVESAESALDQLGYSAVRIPFDRDLGRFLKRFREQEPDVVFNLCESVDEDPRLGWHPAAVLELLGVPFSGSPSSAIMLTTDKVVTKRLLRACGFYTPRYLIYEGSTNFIASLLRFPVIVKPRFEDASIGIDQESVFSDEKELLPKLKTLFMQFGSLLVEEYIDGREFNISLLGYPHANVLPVAEIDFSHFPKDLYRIVGYRAKWESASFEYRHTPREFPTNLPKTLSRRLEMTAKELFRLFMLRDYGRIDLRTDARDRIHVLEVNANPCLSPDAGFAAAAQEAGMSYKALIGRILEYVMQRKQEDAHQTAHSSG